MIELKDLTAKITVLGKEIPVTNTQEWAWEPVRQFVRKNSLFKDARANPENYMTRIPLAGVASWLTCTGHCCRGTGRSFLEALAWVEYAVQIIPSTQNIGFEILPLHAGGNDLSRQMFAQGDILNAASILLDPRECALLVKPVGRSYHIMLEKRVTPVPNMDCFKNLGEYLGEYKGKYIRPGIWLNAGKEQPQPYFFVWNPTNRPPRHQHRTQAAAEKEAERLASLHPGQEFHVLEFKGKVAVKPAKAQWERVEVLRPASPYVRYPIGFALGADLPSSSDLQQNSSDGQKRRCTAFADLLRSVADAIEGSNQP
jgi:hypothetical protein